MQRREARFEKSSISLDVVVVGAGLSGLAAAIGLRRTGHKVTVLEMNAELREAGAAIQLPANSSRIIHDLGFLKEVKEYAVQPQNFSIRSYCGQQLFEQELNPSIQHRFGYPHLLTHRADLRYAFHEEAQKQGAIIRFGARVVSIDFDSATVKSFSGDEYKADLILGADGEHSICRQLFLGLSYAPRSSGDTVYRIAVPTEKIASENSLAHLIGTPSVQFWYGPDSHAVCYRLLKNSILNIALTLPESKGSAIIGPQPGNLEFVRGQFREWDPDRQRLLSLADSTVKWTLLETEDLDTWVHHKDHFALLGDSAHATLPYLAQGAAISLESAHTLSILLQYISDRSQLPDILAFYERVRLPRARSIKNRSKFMHDVCQLVDGQAQRERDKILLEGKPSKGFPNPWADPEYQDWMWGFDAWAEVELLWHNRNNEEVLGAVNGRLRKGSPRSRD